MQKLTRSKIAYDLNISPHKLSVDYENEESLTFVFSSELYRNKFYASFIENREKTNNSLTNRFGFTIVNDVLCDLRLYLMVEKRGFLIYKGEQKIECLNDITLDGHKMIVNNCEKQ